MPYRSRTRNPKPSTIRRRKLAAKRRSELMELLGNVCAHCGSTKQLTFDHISGHRDWDPQAVHSTRRLRIYLDEAREGKGQLLCRACNAAKYDSPEEDE